VGEIMNTVKNTKTAKCHDYNQQADQRATRQIQWNDAAVGLYEIYSKQAKAFNNKLTIFAARNNNLPIFEIYLLSMQSKRFRAIYMNADSIVKFNIKKPVTFTCIL